MRRLFFLGLFLLSVAGPLWVAWQRVSWWVRPPLPVLSQLPAEFELVDHEGRHMGSGEMRGKVWVANFIFTRCWGICPALTAHMRALVSHCGEDPAVRFVSVSVDPSYDTPDVLARYARQHGVRSDRWRFCTGERDKIVELVRRGFLLGVEPSPDPNEPIVHSNRFALVDRQLRVRAYHQPTEQDFVQAVCEDLTRLVNEPSR